MNMKQIRDDAREKMKPHCRVCPICDGRVCAGEVPGMGGMGTGESFMENVRALAAWKLNLRTLHDAAPFDTTLDLFGLTLTSPVMAAPLAGLAAHFEKKLSEPEIVEALLSGCQAGGSLAWTGDGVNPAMFDALTRQPDDPLLALIGLFRADERAGKVDLGVGVYRDETGATPIFRAVKEAERRLVETQPVSGLLDVELVFG